MEYDDNQLALMMQKMQNKIQHKKQIRLVVWVSELWI